MRESKLSPTPFALPPPDLDWLDIDRKAWVEGTSEEKGHPIEFALLPERGGWRAGTPGIKTIWVSFTNLRGSDESGWFSRIPKTRARKSWPYDGPGYWPSFPRNRPPARNFSSPDSMREIEDYTVELSDVHVLELLVSPDKRDCNVRASLLHLRLA
jgi:hypothetical protein